MTGYTHQLVEKDLNFKDFVWTCARAFGALIDMRDEPMDAKIDIDKKENEQYSSCKYHQNEYEKDRKELEEFTKLDVEQKKKGFNISKNNNIELCNAEINKKEQVLLKLKATLREVDNWTPPTSDHAGLKNFMIQQLKESIDWEKPSYYLEELKKWQEKTFEEWEQQRLSDLNWSIHYHEEEMNKEVKSEKNKNDWLIQLRDSIGAP